MKKTTTLAITIAILGLVWAIVLASYAIFQDVIELGSFDWDLLNWEEVALGSIACAIVAIVAAEIYLLAIRKESTESGTEFGALGIIFTVAFLLISILLNSVFALLGRGDFNWLLLALNLVTVAGYVVVLLWVDKASAGLTQRLEKTEKKTAPSVNIGRKLGELLAITEDTEIRGRLLKLKEAVDYSTNISTEATVGKEMQVEDLLDEIARLTLARADRLIILNKVSSAEAAWKMRSSAASSVR